MVSLSHNYALKIDLRLADIDLSRKTKSVGKHVKLKNKNRYAVIRDYVGKENTNKILDLLPTSIREKCIGVTKSSISSLPPHIHTIEHCVINFYHKTNGEETFFYDGNYNIISDNVEDSGNGYYLIDKSNIHEVGSFNALSGDVWLLNTRKAHSVIGNNDLDSSRLVIQVFLNIPYSEAYSLLV